MAPITDDEEIESRLPSGWERDDEAIRKTYNFDDYLVGVSFAVDVAELAEDEFHHPTLTIEYETVTVRYTTHDKGGITDQDFEMAKLTDKLR